MTNTAVKADKITLTHKLPPKNGVKDYAERLIKKEPLFDEINILKNVSFILKKGEGLALIGANGSGKTTLLKTVAGIMSPTSGRIVTNGCISPIACPLLVVEYQYKKMPRRCHFPISIFHCGKY